MNKIYLSGKITGLPLHQATQNFKEAEKRIKNLKPDAEVINPMELPGNADAERTWKECMVTDITYLILHCDCIYLQKNWYKSKGALIEHFIARMLGYVILYD
jgi:hypothetical protein